MIIHLHNTTQRISTFIKNSDSNNEINKVVFVQLKKVFKNL